MKSTTACRCAECKRAFVPDPRIGQRQVTCGALDCQRARHAGRCRIWRSENGETAANHYQDVVVPFRRQQPDYQRRWRWGCRLGEIREEMTLLGGAVLGRLRGLVHQAQQLVQGAMGIVQSGVLAGEKLLRTIGAVRSTISCLEQLQASTAALRELAL